MTDYERGLRDGRLEALGENHAFIESARILIQRSRTELGETFVRSADIWLDEWVRREHVSETMKEQYTKANPQPPRQGGDGGGEG